MAFGLRFECSRSGYINFFKIQDHNLWLRKKSYNTKRKKYSEETKWDYSIFLKRKKKII